MESEKKKGIVVKCQSCANITVISVATSKNHQGGANYYCKHCQCGIVPPFEQLKAFSIKQPWAWMAVNGYKDVENRNWNTNFIGQILIHASKSFDPEGYVWILSNKKELGLDMVNIPMPPEFERGGIVGIVKITDCVVDFDSPWFFGKYGLIMEGGAPIDFIPCKGKLKFFTPEVTNGQ